MRSIALISNRFSFSDCNKRVAAWPQGDGDGQPARPAHAGRANAQAQPERERQKEKEKVEWPEVKESTRVWFVEFEVCVDHQPQTRRLFLQRSQKWMEKVMFDKTKAPKKTKRVAFFSFLFFAIVLATPSSCMHVNRIHDGQIRQTMHRHGTRICENTPSTWCCNCHRGWEKEAGCRKTEEGRTKVPFLLLVGFPM